MLKSKNVVLLIICITCAILLTACSNGLKNAKPSETSTTNLVTESSELTTEDLSGFIEYDKEQLYFNDDIRWGMSSKELNDTVTLYECYKSFKNAANENVHYYYWSYTHKTNTYFLDEQQYWLYEDSDKLNSYMLTFTDEGCTYDNYIAVKDALVEKYGEPEDEHYNYSDETYKNEPSKALEYDYLKIVASWKNNEKYDIAISWSSDMCTITYSEKGYQGNY